MARFEPPVMEMSQLSLGVMDRPWSGAGEAREAGLASVALRAPFARPARWSLRIVRCKVNLALPGTILNEANNRSGFDFLVRQDDGKQWSMLNTPLCFLGVIAVVPPG